MELIYNNKSIYLKECKTFFERLRGFMFTNNIDKALLFNKCNSIHTFFMKKNIDVVMCDEYDNIIYIYNNLGKNKIILPKRKVTKVIEVPVNYFNFKTNTKINIREDL